MVFVELNKVGTKLKAGDKFGDIESVKAVSDLYAPVDGEIVADQRCRRQGPVARHRRPYGKGWMVKIKVPPAPSSTT